MFNKLKVSIIFAILNFSLSPSLHAAVNTPKVQACKFVVLIRAMNNCKSNSQKSRFMKREYAACERYAGNVSAIRNGCSTAIDGN